MQTPPTTPTQYLLGVCGHCQRPVRQRDDDPGLPGAEQVLIACPECGRDVWARRVLAATTDEQCGYACRTAGRPRCQCSCGGAQHGQLFDTDISPDDQDPALAAYRSRVQAAEQAAQTRFARWAEAYPDVMAALTGPDRVLDTVLLLHAAALVEQNPPQPLTSDQVSAVRSALARRAQRAGGRGARQWEPAPTGCVEIEGRVVAVHPVHGADPDDPAYRMAIDCGDYLVEVPVPVELADPAKTRAGNLFGLGGRQVRMTTTITPDPRNTSFGRGECPTDARVLSRRSPSP